jgi:hypothetical protein
MAAWARVLLPLLRGVGGAAYVRRLQAAANRSDDQKEVWMSARERESERESAREREQNDKLDAGGKAGLGCTPSSLAICYRLLRRYACSWREDACEWEASTLVYLCQALQWDSWRTGSGPIDFFCTWQAELVHSCSHPTTPCWS